MDWKRGKRRCEFTKSIIGRSCTSLPLGTLPVTRRLQIYSSKAERTVIIPFYEHPRNLIQIMAINKAAE